jgi:hypothetical protein
MEKTLVCVIGFYFAPKRRGKQFRFFHLPQETPLTPPPGLCFNSRRSRLPGN